MWLEKFFDKRNHSIEVRSIEDVKDLRVLCILATKGEIDATSLKNKLSGVKELGVYSGANLHSIIDFYKELVNAYGKNLKYVFFIDPSFCIGDENFANVINKVSQDVDLSFVGSGVNRCNNYRVNAPLQEIVGERYIGDLYERSECPAFFPDLNKDTIDSILKI
ncbi:hypothetical protein M1145_03075 [Patescibacteria group bacterium]|nr:hypothetical protein [Patescibacteria group bacterium]